MNQTHDVISEEMFHVLDNLISVPVILFNQNEIIHANQPCLQMLGYQCFKNKREEEQVLRDLVDADIFQKMWNIQKVTKENDIRELLMHKKDGMAIFVEYNAKPVKFHECPYVLMELQDITEKKYIELNLIHLSKVRERMLEISQSVLDMENIEDIYDLILKNALDCIEHSQLGSIFRLDGDVFKIVAYKGFVEDIETFALPVEESTLYMMSDGKMDETKYMRNISHYDRFYPVHTKYGEEFIKSTVTSPIRINGKLFGMINIDSLEPDMFTEDDLKTMEFIRNSVEIAISNHLLYEKTRYLARYDAMTAMYNRAQFSEMFAKVVNEYGREKKKFYVVIFDMNGLKRLNDGYGHLVGDAAIRLVAGAIKHVTRTPDMVARIGGDEFCGLYFNVSKEELVDRFERTLKYLNEHPCKEDGYKVSVSFSYGISHFPEEGTGFTELTSIADERMYQYKKMFNTCRIV